LKRNIGHTGAQKNDKKVRVLHPNSVCRNNAEQGRKIGKNIANERKESWSKAIVGGTRTILAFVLILLPGGGRLILFLTLHLRIKI
jgi:hypothetical protein